MLTDATKNVEKKRGACSVVFRESDEKKIQYCTATHSAVGAGNSVRADATKNVEKRRGACSVVFREGDEKTKKSNIALPHTRQ